MKISKSGTTAQPVKATKPVDVNAALEAVEDEVAQPTSRKVRVAGKAAEKALSNAGLRPVRKNGKAITVETEIATGKNGKLSAKGLPCLFSGEQTITPGARFLPGYDAKLKSVLLKVEKGEATVDEIPALARQWMQSEPLVGFRMKGDRLVRVAAAA